MSLRLYVFIAIVMRLFSSLLKLAAGVVAGEALVMMKTDRKLMGDLKKKKTFGDKAKLFFDRLWKFNKDVVNDGAEVVKENTPSMNEIVNGVHGYLQQAHNIGVEKWNQLDNKFQSKEKINEVVKYLDTFTKYLKEQTKNKKTTKKAPKKTIKK